MCFAGVLGAQDVLSMGGCPVTNDFVTEPVCCALSAFSFCGPSRFCLHKTQPPETSHGSKVSLKRAGRYQWDPAHKFCWSQGHGPG